MRMTGYLRAVRCTALLLCCHVSAFAASFDCRKAQRPVEQAICSNATLSAEDERLAQLYRTALARLSSNGAGQVRADQVQWLAWLQQVCPAADGKAAPAQRAACLLPLYRARTRLMRLAAVRRDGTTFVTRSQYFAAPDDRVEFKKYGDFHGTGTLQASWPAADPTDPQWQAWSRAMEERALRMAVASRLDDTQRPSSTWGVDLALQRNATVTSVVRSVEHGRVTVSLSSESMGIPAAHPGELYETDTWLLAAGRLLQPTDVFAPGAPWQAQLGAACYAALKAGSAKDYLFAEVTGPDAKALQAVIADPHNWTLEHDGLHITYPEYAVAPRVAQPEDTVLAWATLKPVLAAGFVAP